MLEEQSFNEETKGTEVHPDDQKKTQKVEYKNTFEISTVLSSDGWLSRDGYFTKCNADEHDACAEHIWKKISNPLIKERVEKEGLESPREILKSCGYIQMSHKIPQILEDQELTREQIETFKRSGYNLPKPARLNMSPALRKAFSEPFPGYFEPEDMAYIDKMLRDTFGWGDNIEENTQHALEILKKITNGLEKGTRISCIKNKRFKNNTGMNMKGTYYQYWPVGDNHAIIHKHYIHDGQTATSTNSDTPDYYDVIGVKDMEWVKSHFKEIEKSWEGNCEITEASAN